MGLRNTDSQYGSVAKFFHWTVSSLVIFMLFFGFFMGYADKPFRYQLYNVHKAIGLIILALMILRAIWALSGRKPKYPDTMNTLTKYLAGGVQLALYIVVIAMPITGILMSSAGGHKVSFFGLFNAAIPMAINKPLSEFMESNHELIAWFIIGLAAIHILAALKHHFIDKDNILRRMLPFGKLK